MPTDEIWQSLTENINRKETHLRIDIPHHPYDIQIEKGCLSQTGQWLRELTAAATKVVIEQITM